MNLLSINTKTRQVTAYAVTGGKRVKLMEPIFDRLPEPEEVEAMRRNPQQFVYGGAVDTHDSAPSGTEPSCA